MKFACSDLKPGDLVRFYGGKTLEVVVLNVDHKKRTWTHLCITDDHRSDNIGTIYTPPACSVDSWGCLWADAEIVSRQNEPG